MKVTARMLGREKVMRLLNEVVPEAEKELAKAQLEGMQRVAGKIKTRAPGPRTGAYQASIQADRLANRPEQRALGGKASNANTKDKNAAGVFASYIWKFLEFGTVKMTKRPHIFPTWRFERKAVRRKMAAAVRKAVKNAKSK